mmetsp:Transcript_2271/g.3990  ORF Transcript_2271/g.3990 Transcript_2271/m.3990 type:complete len:250 (-) Transcript_2271:1421-2170(-)
MSRVIKPKKLLRVFSKEIESEKRKPFTGGAYSPGESSIPKMYPYKFAGAAPVAGRGGKTASGMYKAQALIEKQKMRFYYGNLLDYQFKQYVIQAMRLSKSNPDDTLMKLLELRLDTVLYRTGFVNSHRQAQNWIYHGHVLLNGRKATLKGMQMKPGDVVSIHPNFVNLAAKQALNVALQRRAAKTGASWCANSSVGMLPYLEIDRQGLSAILVRNPIAHELQGLRSAMLFPLVKNANLCPKLAMSYYKV